MERFDIQIDLSRNTWGLKKRDDGQGMFVYAGEALQYKERYHMALVFAAALAFGYVASTAYIVFHKHDPQPVQVSEAEYREAQQQAQQAQAERAALLRRIEDLGAIRRNLSAQLRTQNANNAKLVQQLKEVQASVPPLPIIQEALRKEAATDAGFKAAVARNFGPIRVEVRE